MINCVCTWIEEQMRLEARPWLLVGKGPSLDRHLEWDLDPFYILTLNHACRVIKPTLAHFTDLEALAECIEELLDEGVGIVAPWHPHVNFHPSPNNLGDYIRNDAVTRLDEAARRNLLFTYNSTRSRTKVAAFRTVPVRFFSAVAGLNLLALSGVRSVRSLGVDGGTKYANLMDEKDCLANGQTSFDRQFDEMRKTVANHKLEYRSLTGAAL